MFACIHDSYVAMPPYLQHDSAKPIQISPGYTIVQLNLYSDHVLQAPFQGWIKMISLRPSQMIGKMQLTSLHRNGEALTTKATIFLCNAPLQDIIFRFMERKDEDSW